MLNSAPPSFLSLLAKVTTAVSSLACISPVSYLLLRSNVAMINFEIFLKPEEFLSKFIFILNLAVYEFLELPLLSASLSSFFFR